MKVYKIFPSIDGEVNKFGQGRMTTFIRFSGCNLHCSYCFGIVPGRRKPRLILSRAKNKKINDVVVGDKLLTFDDDRKLVETEVVNTIKREVNEWIRLKINNILYFVTNEHPFFTTKGLVNACDLKIGDKILHSIFNQKLYYQKTINNPMKNKDVVLKSILNTDYKTVGKKISKTIRLKQKNREYVHPYDLLTEEQRNETRKKISQSKIGDKNPNWKGGVGINYSYLKQKVKDREIIECQKCGKKADYNVEIKKGRGFGLDVHHKDDDHNNDDWNNLEVVCESCHYSDHEVGYNFWNSNRVDGKSLNVINGFEVQDIKKINRFDKPPSIRPKPLKVFNFTCYPYNSYLVDYMWVHNCDTQYARGIDSGKEMTVYQIIDEVDKCVNNKVTITGGEPLLQQGLTTLVSELKRRKYLVSVETNGSIDIPVTLKGFVDSWVVDYKLPSSGMEDFMLSERFYKFDDWDYIKFVIQDRNDFDVAVNIKSMIKKVNDRVNFAFSPCFGYIEPQQLIDWLTEVNIGDVILNVQLHKLLWPDCGKDKEK